MPNPNSEIVSLPRNRLPYLAGGLTASAVLLAIGLSALTTSSGSAQSQVAGIAETTNTFEIQLTAKSAVVIDISTEKTLFELNPNAQLPLASLTKVPLVLVISEVLSPDSLITLPRDLPQVGKFETLKGGIPWPVREVIDFTLIASSNEGAEFLAAAAETGIRRMYSQAPQRNAVLWRMNGLAKELGLLQTYFLNVSGLDISTTLAGSYGSARDMAALFTYAYKNQSNLFSGTTRGNVLLSSEYGQTVAYNTNTAEAEIPGLILGKTGFTDLAGGNLAIVFDLGLAHPVVAIVLGSTKEGRFEDMRKLVEATRKAATE